MIANTALQIYGTDEVIARPMRMKKKTPLSKIWFPENKDGVCRPYFSFFAVELLWGSGVLLTFCAFYFSGVILSLFNLIIFLPLPSVAGRASTFFAAKKGTKKTAQGGACKYKSPCHERPSLEIPHAYFLSYCCCLVRLPFFYLWLIFNIYFEIFFSLLLAGQFSTICYIYVALLLLVVFACCLKFSRKWILSRILLLSAAFLPTIGAETNYRYYKVPRPRNSHGVVMRYRCFSICC